MVTNATRHERVVQRFAQPVGDAGLRFAFVAQVNDISSNEIEKAGTERIALGVRHARGILRQFFGTYERAHGAPHQLRHVVGRVKLRDRSSVPAHPVWHCARPQHVLESRHRRVAMA